MEPQHKPVGAPERLDVPFELKAIQTLTGDDGVEVGVFEGLASTFGNRDMVALIRSRRDQVIAPSEAFR